MNTETLYPSFSKAEFSHRYRDVREAMRAADISALIFYSTTGSYHEVLDVSDYIHQAGFTICDDLVHGFGGGYLKPILRTRRTSTSLPETFVFRENMVVVIQPNVITEDERMGIQVGEIVRVRPGGVETLHQYPMRFVQC